jgi:polyhydroxyalkanoate synthesis regulator phasin
MPFQVPPPFDKMLKEATTKVEEVAGQTRDAATRLEQKVRSAATTMKKKGETWAKDPKAFAMKVTTDMSKEATRIADDVTMKVTDAVEEMIKVSLHKMNVPTFHEMQTLNRKVDLLAKKIDAMAPKVRRARKPRVAR